MTPLQEYQELRSQFVEAYNRVATHKGGLEELDRHSKLTEGELEKYYNLEHALKVADRCEERSHETFHSGAELYWLRQAKNICENAAVKFQIPAQNDWGYQYVSRF